MVIRGHSPCGLARLRARDRSLGRGVDVHTLDPAAILANADDEYRALYAELERLINEYAKSVPEFTATELERLADRLADAPDARRRRGHAISDAIRDGIVDRCACHTAAGSCCDGDA